MKHRPKSAFGALNKNPGPGNYNPDGTKSTNTGVSIGKSERTTFKDKAKEPGPG